MRKRRPREIWYLAQGSTTSKDKSQVSVTLEPTLLMATMLTSTLRVLLRCALSLVRGAERNSDGQLSQSSGFFLPCWHQGGGDGLGSLSASSWRRPLHGSLPCRSQQQSPVHLSEVHSTIGDCLLPHPTPTLLIYSPRHT